MKYQLKEISELDDWFLIDAYDKCGQAEKQREEASKNPKFTTDKKKMQFPPVNPKFIEMKNEIESEMKKRKIIS